MRHARWLDHLPLWIVFGAVARTGIYEPWEILFMAAPLLGAGIVEFLRKDLSRLRLPFELGALAWLAFDFMAHPGFFGQMVRLLFLLSGIRLALPRLIPQRRQLVLMGFLLFLTTAISNANFEFFVWTLLWMGAVSTVLLQMAWEQSSSRRRGSTARPPFRRVPVWGAGALALAAALFLLLPRVTTGWHPFPAFGAALGQLQAGLSDQVDLGQSGSINANHTVVMRVVPPSDLSDAQRESLGSRLAYLRGLTLEKVEGQRWESSEFTPPPLTELGIQGDLPPEFQGTHLELFLNPTPRGMVPLPYGTAFVSTPFSQRLRRGEGGSLRLPFPVTRGIPLQVVLNADPELAQKAGMDQGPLPLEDARPPMGRRLLSLLQMEPSQEVARRTSLAWAPNAMSAPALAASLMAHLRTFQYTLDNPSGGAANPLEDFLEHTQAGHCEFYASALALMLRSRGVPARVVNGYRLGSWVPEGGYWLVTENEAHAWVEYWDGDAKRWRMADGTPPLSTDGPGGWLDTWTRVTDALAFRWDRYVVRYSGEDQAAGIHSLQSLSRRFLQGFSWSWKRPSPLAYSLIGLLVLAWASWRFRPRRLPANLASPKGSKLLAPLLRRTRRLAPPQTGETARAWLARLALLRPDRATSLQGISEGTDRALYGRGPEDSLKSRVKAEARAWK